jgi:LysR family transcriptional regulator, glycine cleavage system transcriptional activator
MFRTGGSDEAETDAHAGDGRARAAGAANVPPLQSLHTLEVLSRHRRIGAAAAELGLSHAAVSQTVSRLEKRLRVQLFLKSSWGVEATPQCRNLIEAYLSASSTLARALSDASGARRLRILLPKTAWLWLSPAIARLYRCTPELSFRAYQDDDVVDLDSADFAIVASGHVAPRGFEGAALYDERLIPVCSPAFAASAKIETPASLARAPLLIAQRDQWLAWFARAGLVSEPDMAGPRFTDSTLAMEAALRGQGVALCCTVAAAAAISRGELVAPIALSAKTDRRFWAAWRGAQREPAARVLDWLLAELQARRSPHVSLVEEAVRQPAEKRRRGGERAPATATQLWPRGGAGLPEGGQVAADPPRQ